MRVEVHLHAGWSVNHVVPLLFPDKPILDAVLTDEVPEKDGLVLLLDGIACAPGDATPERLGSRYIEVLGDVLLGGYDHDNPHAVSMVERWYKLCETRAKSNQHDPDESRLFRV